MVHAVVVTSPSRPRRSFLGQAQSMRELLARADRLLYVTPHLLCTSVAVSVVCLIASSLCGRPEDSAAVSKAVKSNAKGPTIFGGRPTRPGRLQRGPRAPSHLVIAPATMQHPRQLPFFTSVSLSQPNSRYQPHPTLSRPEHERRMAQIVFWNDWSL